MSAANKPVFHSLEIGRFIAAFVVMMFHVVTSEQATFGGYSFGDVFRAGHSGVEYFFVLSGFLIFFIHAEWLDRSGGGLEFVRRRLVRIMPAYWIIFGVFIAGMLAKGGSEHLELTPVEILKDWFLLPAWNEQMMLSVSWTLKREFIFYGIFAICLLFPRYGMAPLWGWQIAILAVNIYDPQHFSGTPKGDELFGIVNLGFGAGMLIAYAIRRDVFARLPEALRPGWIWIAVGASGMLGAWVFEWWQAAGGDRGGRPLGLVTSPPTYILLATLLVTSFVTLERDGKINLSRTPPILGKCSYALYLLHLPAFYLIFKVLGRFDFGEHFWIATLIACTLTVIGSMVFHQWVEAPVMAWINRHTKPKKRETAEPKPAAPSPAAHLLLPFAAQSGRQGDAENHGASTSGDGPRGAEN